MELSCLVLPESGDVVPVDLEDLVAEAEAAHCRGTIPGHEAHEHALVDGLHPDAHLAVGVLAQNNLPG